jgi:hypothetical protein
MVETITQKTKGKAEKKSKDAALARIKEGRELVPLVAGSYIIHNSFNVACI